MQSILLAVSEVELHTHKTCRRGSGRRQKRQIPSSLEGIVANEQALTEQDGNKAHCEQVQNMRQIFLLAPLTKNGLGMSSTSGSQIMTSCRWIGRQLFSPPLAPFAIEPSPPSERPPALACPNSTSVLPPCPRKLRCMTFLISCFSVESESLV